MFADIYETCQVHKLVSKTMLQPLILITLVVRMSVFVLVCVILPTANYPIVFRHPRLPVL